MHYMSNRMKSFKSESSYVCLIILTTKEVKFLKLVKAKILDIFQIHLSNNFSFCLYLCNLKNPFQNFLNKSLEIDAKRVFDVCQSYTKA